MTDLPYEPVPDGPIAADASDVADVLAAGVTLMALTVDLDDGYKAGGVVFTFYGPDRQLDAPRVLLVLDDDRLEELPQLVRAVVNGALEAARKARP